MKQRITFAIVLFDQDFGNQDRNVLKRMQEFNFSFKNESDYDMSTFGCIMIQSRLVS